MYICTSLLNWLWRWFACADAASAGGRGAAIISRHTPEQGIHSDDDNHNIICCESADIKCDFISHFVVIAS